MLSPYICFKLKHTPISIGGEREKQNEKNYSIFRTIVFLGSRSCLGILQMILYECPVFSPRNLIISYGNIYTNTEMVLSHIYKDL